MKLTQLTLSNFQSFGAVPIAVPFAEMTFLIGPNGAGKTAVLQALTRLFGSDPALRRLRQSDFHSVRTSTVPASLPIALSVEAQFEFPELADGSKGHPTIPGHFAHMQLESPNGVPRVRLRLEAELHEDGEIEEHFYFVVQVDEQGQPLKKVPASRHDRNQIQVHYLPARRDPSDHISYATNSLMGRALRAANWHPQTEEVAELSSQISQALSQNEAIASIDSQLGVSWRALHKSLWFADPKVSFGRDELEGLLRQLTVGFAPGPDGAIADYSRLSDGQKSMLYLTVVLSLQQIGRHVLAKQLDSFSIERLKPPVFTLIAMEEPENSLSPHYLGRVVNTLTKLSASTDAQAVVATHAPSLLRRVSPESVRYLRLNADRTTSVRTVTLPDETEEAHKFVREAVQAFPELYFSRAVVLGEGDSEEIVVTRFLEATGLRLDDASISVVPLGGRHVSHFWRLLHGLGIPYVTLLDLDLGRYQGGWGRIKYASEQLLQFPTAASSNLKATHIPALPKWDSTEAPHAADAGKQWLSFLENAGVFFSAPLDLDFLMIQTIPDQYGVDKNSLTTPDEKAIVSVLGKSHAGVALYSDQERSYFDNYHRLFKLGSKPGAHLNALAQLDQLDLDLFLPPVLERMFDRLKKMLAELPE